MLYSPLAVANYFIKKALDAGSELTTMKLVKLVYIAHGWYLGITGEALISETVQAWKYGPVVPSVYRAFKKHGKGNISSTYTNGSFEIPIVKDNEQVELFLDKIWEVYSKFDGLQLSTLTHQENTPWDITWKKGTGYDDFISNALIKEHYSAKARAENSNG